MKIWIFYLETRYCWYFFATQLEKTQRELPERIVTPIPSAIFSHHVYVWRKRHGSRSVVRTGSMSHLMLIPCTSVLFPSLLFEDILMTWGLTWDFSGISSCEIVLQDTTLRPLDCWIWPGLAIHNSDWNFQQSRVFTCFVLSCGGFFANGLSTVCPFCRNCWLLEFGSQLSHSVFCTCKLNSSMNFMRIVSTVIVAKIVAAVRSEVGLETSLDMTYQEGPSAVCFLSVREKL